MREILIISGKGGTGKTSLTAAFAHLAKDKILCDLDVDAPDLHLILQPDHKQTVEFYSGNEARINPDLCQGCGDCMDHCRFGAIAQNGGVYEVDSLHCEGCKVCVHFCPAQAIDFPENHCGQWFVSDTRFGPMVHAQLFPGQENSGRLVTLLKQQAKARAKEQGLDLVLCDGAPGIGCPVIASLSGADLAVVVTEPTPSGRHDLERVVELCEHFRLAAGVLINKFDLNLEEAGRIEEICRSKNLHLLGRLPHDPAMTQAMIQGRAITENGNNELSKLVKQAWSNILELAEHKQAA